jgi:predicted kinase
LSRAPCLILLMGLPGAGKSTLARALARRRGDARVDRDALRARLFRGLPVTAERKRIANAAVWRRAARLLRARRSVIVDGMTLASAAERRHAHALARRLRARSLEIYLDCPPALACRRVLRAAAHPATDRSPALVAAVAQRFDPVAPDALRLDARRPAGTLLAAALSWLASAPERGRARPRAPAQPRRPASARAGAR